jgi:multisubunit Na+/H+ antiporter MnhE subunit
MKIQLITILALIFGIYVFIAKPFESNNALIGAVIAILACVIGGAVLSIKKR